MSGQSKLVVISALVVALLLGGAGAAILADRSDNPFRSGTVSAQEVSKDRAINVDGEGRVTMVPDTARVTLGVLLEGEEIEDLREDANTRMNDVLDGLEEDGIDESDIRTVRYDISVLRDWDNREPEIIGYEIMHLVEVKVQPIEDVGMIIDNALDNGANNVGNVSFEVEDREEAVRQAREHAMNDALDKAEHLAELGGVSLGAPISISEESPSPMPVAVEERMAMDDVAEAGAPTEISPGEAELIVRVKVSYGIE